MFVKNRTLPCFVRYGIAVGAVAFSIQARADGGAMPMQLATGQFITPTAPRGSVQQFLNPGLAAYPDFIAGEAVRSRLSPDGATLAVLCAGQNSLYKSDGTIDTPASTQFIFLYDVSGAHSGSPVLTQVLPQTNSGAWSYTAEASTVLSTTTVAQGPAGLKGVKYASGPVVKPKHDARYWAKRTAGFDFSDADRVPPAKFNKVIWRGLMGRRPYPATAGAHREGRQLADNRDDD